MFFLTLLDEFTKKYGQRHLVVFFEIVFYLSKRVKTKIGFHNYRNTKIDFSLKKFKKLCQQYFLLEKPLAHITKHTTFCHLDFLIEKKVLVPRQNTEKMTQDFIRYFKKTKNRKVVDLCCGCGAVGLTIKKYLPTFQVNCIDKYFRPVINTKLNSQMLKLKIKVIKKDVFEYLAKQRQLDLIISNPPYVNKKTFKNKKMLRWESKKALFAQNNGYAFYDYFFSWLEKHDFKQCWLEFGFEQKRILKTKLKKIINLRYCFKKNNYVIIEQSRCKFN